MMYVMFYVLICCFVISLTHLIQRVTCQFFVNICEIYYQFVNENSFYTHFSFSVYDSVLRVGKKIFNMPSCSESQLTDFYFIHHWKWKFSIQVIPCHLRSRPLDLQRYIIAGSIVAFLNSSEADKVHLFWLNRIISSASSRNTQEYYEKYERQ